MRPISREEARDYDLRCEREWGIPGLILMENAAIGIAREILASSLPPGPAAIVCGPGNNGGDGFAVARHLALRGVETRLHLLVPEDAYREGSPAAIQLRIARSMRIPRLSGLSFEGAALVVDAIFGTGLAREVREPYRGAIRAINESGRPVVAVDLPSGLDANSGRPLGLAVRATLTVTMVAPKLGFYLADGPAHVGEVRVVGIGAPAPGGDLPTAP